MTEETNTPEWASLVYHRSQERRIPSEIRKRVLRRDKRRCVRCGVRKRLEVHHITPRREGGGLNLQNLVTLCSDCHDEIEPLCLRSRTLIENWEVKGDVIQHKEAAHDSEEWHAWVYGGYTRPEQELEQTEDGQFISVSEKVWLRMINEEAEP